VLGIGQAAFIPAALALVAAEERRRGLSLSVFTGGSALGRSAGLFAAGLVLSSLALIGIAAQPDGWRLLCVLTIVPNLLLLVALARRLPDQSVARRPAAATPLPPGLWGSFAVAILPVFAIQTLAAWLPMLVVRHHLTDAATAPLFLGGVDVVSAPVGHLLGGWLIAGGRRRAALSPSPLVVGALTLAILPVVAVTSARSLWLLAPALFAVNLLLSLSAFAALFDAQTRMPAARRGELSGVLLALVTAVGAGLGPLLAGVVSASAQQGGEDRLSAALILSTMMAAAIAAAAVLASRRLSRRERTR
jgi:MFS family permease